MISIEGTNFSKVTKTAKKSLSKRDPKKKRRDKKEEQDSENDVKKTINKGCICKSERKYQTRTLKDELFKNKLNQNSIIQRERVIEYKCIPNHISNDPKTFMLRGDIFIDLSTEDHNHLSNQNHYKEVRSVTICKDKKLIYTKIDVDESLLDSHSKVIKILECYPDKEEYDLSKKLRIHEQWLMMNLQVKREMTSILSQNKVMQLMVTSKIEEFIHFRQKIINNLPKERYFLFADFQFDYGNNNLKLTGCGMNEQFVQFIGSDLQTMQEISIRKGLLQFIEPRFRMKMLNQVLDIFNSKTKIDLHYQGRISLITLDDIFVDLEFIVDLYLSKSSDVFQPFFHSDYSNFLSDRGFFVFEILLTPFHLLMIDSMRKKSISDGKEQKINLKNNSRILQDQNEQINTKIQDFISDIPYTMQSQLFIDKFYGGVTSSLNQQQIQIQPPTKMCGYRTLQYY